MKTFCGFVALILFGSVASACPPVAISSHHDCGVQVQALSVQAFAVPQVSYSTVQVQAVAFPQVQLLAVGGCSSGHCGVRASRVRVLGGRVRALVQPRGQVFRQRTVIRGG